MPTISDGTGLDVDHLRQWVGKTQTVSDAIVAAPIAGLLATLDYDVPSPQAGDSLPPLGHWLYFQSARRQSEIGQDGHPKRGGFLPPVPLPRRMWAATRIEFVKPLRVGQSLSRVSRIGDVQMKSGRTGALVFVNVRHEIHGDDTLSITEEQDIVYRDMPRAGAPTPVGVSAPENESWSRQIEPNDVLLFRYSALTFNGHRIHYDRRYATTVEGYPGLVVHGPLIATLLVDLLRRELPVAQIRSFSFRAMKPLFDVAPFFVCGRRQDAQTVKLWARTAEGHLAMDASATLA
jgi:3-methylfumaryl-CoA hydratase